MDEHSKLSTMTEDEHFNNDDELAEMFGYSGNVAAESSSEEVVHENKSSFPFNSCRLVNAKHDFIQPVPSQILTVFENLEDTVPIHVDLDSGATLNYCTENEVLNRGFKIYPNCQLSKLGDGTTKIKSIGEIHEIFFRNKRKFIFNAVVCKKLNSPFIGGTLFIKENGIEQDFEKNVIHLNGRQVTVHATDPVSILPMQPIISKVQVDTQQPIKFSQFKRRTLLPGQCQDIKMNFCDGTVLAIEPYEKNDDPNWPRPHLQTVQNGKISIKNDTNNALLLGSQVKLCKISSTIEVPDVDEKYYVYNGKMETQQPDGLSNLMLINHNKMVSSAANKIIEEAHSKYHAVFNKDLSQGYN